MPTPRIRYHAAVTLDGYIANPDGSFDFLHDFPPEAAGIDQFMTHIGGLLMGRDTYDVIQQYGPWPYGHLPTAVMTHRPLDGSASPSVRTHAGDPAAALADRAARIRPNSDIGLVGGGQLAATLIAARQLHRIELAIIPVLLGQGIPLIARIPHLAKLTLVETKPLPRSMLWLSYDLA
jgi:dihydrofolate reductase